MPELNVDAVSSLLGYMSTGLGLFLTLPSLYFGWRDCFPYISLHINWIWSVAEALSLAGLLIVPGALTFQIVLVVWYLISDLAFVVEAIIINGYLGASHYSPSKFAEKRARDYWTNEQLEEWTLHKAQHPDARPSAVQKSLTREDNMVERGWVGARWRRDIEIQLASLFCGFCITVIFWYLVFFRTGSASKEYEWEKSVISQFDRTELVGWAFGWLSSFVYMLGRIQEEYKVRNAVLKMWNACRRNRKDPENYHDMRPAPDDLPYGVAAVCTVVFSVFMFDNILQLVSIFVILKGQDGQTARRYVLFQAPWIFGSIIPIGLDARAIYNYRRAMRHGRAAKLYGHWWYGSEPFPTKPVDPAVQGRFESIWHSTSARIELLEEMKKAKKNQRSRGEQRAHARRLQDAEAAHGPYRRRDSYRQHEEDIELAQERNHGAEVLAKRQRAATRTKRAQHKVAKRIGLGGPSRRPMQGPAEAPPEQRSSRRNSHADSHSTASDSDFEGPAITPHLSSVPTMSTFRVDPPTSFARNTPPAHGNTAPLRSLSHPQRGRRPSRAPVVDSSDDLSESASHSSDGLSDSEMREHRQKSSRFALGRSRRGAGGDSSEQEGLLR